MLKLIEFFTTENSNILRHLSEFITKAFERKGQTVLYSIENSTCILPTRFRPESRHVVSYLAYYIFSQSTYSHVVNVSTVRLTGP